MLHSATTVKNATCRRRGVWTRAGVPGGPPWEGFRVGSYVHAALLARAQGQPDPDPRRLAILERVEAQKLLTNATAMGFPSSFPAETVFERSYLFQIGQDGSPGEIREAPESAIRGAGWDPAAYRHGTFFRLQPDAWYRVADVPGLLAVEDYKTALGMMGDDKVGRDPQVVTYAAAMGLLTGAQRVQVVLWSLRWKQGQRVERPTETWLDMARPIWAECFREDSIDEEDLEDSLSPHVARCGTCEFRASCKPPADADLDDGALFMAAQLLSAQAGTARANLNERLKNRTSCLSLHDGTILGPHRIDFTKFIRGKKPDGLRAVAAALSDAGMDPFAFLAPGGDSLRDWIADLPHEAKTALAEWTQESSRQTYLSRSRQDALADLLGESTDEPAGDDPGTVETVTR